MPIPDPDKIWPKLEMLGVEEVRKRLSMGVYAKYKIPVIEEWLCRQETNTVKDDSQHFNAVSTKNISKVDRYVDYAKNHAVISFIIILGIAVIALANFTDAISRLAKFLPLTKLQTSLSLLAGETGWIFVGYFDVQSETFIEGPYVSVVSSSRRGTRRYVEIGDKVRLNVAQKVYVVEFARSGASKNLMSPIEKGVIGKGDETGMELPTNTELIVRDVSEGHRPNNPNAALWLRVVDVPK